MECIIDVVCPFEYRLSHHARQRMNQRAIGHAELSLALSLGDVTWSHGDTVYTVTDRALRGTPWARLADRLRGLIIVVSPEFVVITVKWDHRKKRRAGVLRRAA